MTTINTLVSSISFPVALRIDTPPPAEIGSESSYPFTIYLSADNLGPHTVKLYEDNSNSMPWLTPQNKWSHLLPQWRFTDTASRVIDSITFSQSSIVTNITGGTIGMIASAEFYYVDDLPTIGCDPILIWATLEVSGNHAFYDSSNYPYAPSFANSKVICVVPYYINSLAPTHLNIRRDGIHPMFDIYWTNIHMPHVVTVHGTPNTTWCPGNTGDSILFDVPSTNYRGVQGGPLYRTIVDILSASQTWTPINLNSYLSALDDRSLVIGGFLRSDVVASVSALSTSISAYVSAVYDGVYRHDPFVWVSNPENGTINRLYMPCVPDTTIAEITSFVEKEKLIYGNAGTNLYLTPILSSIEVMTLSGFSGIYGIAVDPCYNVWATDSEMDKIYKISTRGAILSTIEVSNLLTLNTEDTSEIVAQYSPPPYPIGDLYSLGEVVADENYIYAAVQKDSGLPNNDSTIQIYDKNTFTLVGSADFGHAVSFRFCQVVKVKGDYAYLIGPSVNTIDITTPSAPITVDTIYIDTCISAQIVGNYMYCFSSTGQCITILDISAGIPVNEGVFNITGISGTDNISRLYTDEKNIIVVSTEDKTIIVDVTYKTAPVQRYTFNEKFAASFSGDSRYLYLVGTDVIHIYDLTDMNSPVFVSSSVISGASISACNMFMNKHMFITKSNPPYSGPYDILYVHFPTPLAPQLISEISTTSIQRNRINISSFGLDNKNAMVLLGGGQTISPFTSTLEIIQAYSDGQGSTPAGISLDDTGGVWVSLFDNTKVLKLNKDGEHELTIEPGGNNPLPYPLNTVSAGTDPTFKPTLAETDKNGNVWVSYTNSLCSAIYQYTNVGAAVPLKTITLPTCSNPMDILVDFDNNIWVTLTIHSGAPYLSGAVRKYNTTTNPPTLVSSMSAMHPEYLAMDPDGNIWFTSSFRTVSYITTAGDVSSFHAGISSDPPWAVNDKLEYNALEGIASNSYGTIFVVNSLENSVYVFKNKALVDTVKILPDRDYSWYNDSGFITVSANQWAKSAQAFGDWTGFRWQTKYTETGTLTAYLTGQSNDFDIRDFSGFNIRKFNENWEPTITIQDYTVTPHIHDNTVLWDSFINAVWGDNSFNENSYGRKVYERIANFVANHEDINVCNIPQLYSLSNKLDVPIDNYNLNYPAELKRMMDIVSINQQVLWGARCNCRLNITNEYETNLSGGQYVPIERSCPRCGHEHPGNRGQLFDATTYTVTAYVPFIIKDNYEEGKYTLVNPSLCCDGGNYLTRTCVSSYLLSENYENILPNIYLYTGMDFATVVKRFCFYDYVNYPCNDQIAGVINWDDQYTTLDENISGTFDWFGEGETVEKILNYLLHKGLGLIQE